MKIKLKSYHDFRKNVLDEPPIGVEHNLVNIFRPKTQPDIDIHYEGLRYFLSWLNQTKANPHGYPNDASDINTEIGVWIYICCSKWANRYELQAMQAKLGTVASNGVLNSALLAILGFVGFDGDIESDEIAAPLATVLAKLGIPVPLASKEMKATRNHNVIESIEKKYND